MARRLALIIGNSEYEDASLSALVTPGADVNALAGVLRDSEVGGFDEVTALVNQPAAAILRAIAGFFAEREREDLLLLYFSGHGIRDDRGQLFLAAKDTEHRLLRGTAIPSSFITEEMDSSRARRQVLILDCCHSGAFSRGMKGAPGASVGTATAFEGTGSGRVVLTAIDSTQYAWEGDQVIGQAENSVFTHHLIQGLRTGAADTDSDGRITLDELYDYVYGLVVNETPRQTPSKWSYGQQGEIVLARNPRPVVKPAELPADLQQTLEDPRPWVRESSLRELERLLQGSHRGLALAARQALERLTEDDSRRVASAAAETLAAYPEATAPTASAPESAMSMATLREPQESILPAQIEAKPQVKRKSGDGAMGPKVVTHPNKVSDSPRGRVATNGVLAWIRALGAVIRSLMSRSILVTAAGWGLGGALGTYYSWNRGESWGVVVYALIFGLTVGLVLRHRQRSFNWARVAPLCAAWGISVYLGGFLTDPVANGAGDVLSNLVSGDNTWKLGWWIGIAIAGFLGGTVGGIATGLALHWTKYSLPWKRARIVALGWAIGYSFAWVIAVAFADGTNWEDMRAVVIGYGLGGLIAGLIGGAVMFSQLARAGEPDKSLSPATSS